MQGVFAGFAAAAFVAASVIPAGAALAEVAPIKRPVVSLYASTLSDVQAFSASNDLAAQSELQREEYTVYVKPKPTPTPVVPRSGGSGWTPPFVSPDPGSAQAIAYGLVTARGWGDGEFSCLVALWAKESGWRVNAYNRSSGAYGIPQALPGSKMASAGADWASNPATQISWGLGYIGGRYGSPCAAWGHSQNRGWY